ncbi:hypothetical protein JKF63_02136 [Porcisia hertigi]|uniref:Guanine nucleotide-binding protein subunit beta-like protein n=1 Tax=Porcisia hertigi TaxID=2761500 RepID=A0A836LCE7_9TRYP|nr:hypothetical protein JKF63_02136 [Porcisia hertigi]
MWLAMQDGRVEVRDAHTGQAVHVFAIAGVRQRRSKVWCMLSVYDVVHQEAQLWMGLSSGAIEVYTEDYQLRRQLSKHLSGVYCLAQHRGVVTYAGSSDFTITQWRVADGQLLRVLTGHSNYVRCLYAEGTALVSGSDDNTVRVWDTASGASIQQYRHLHRDSGGVSALCRVGTVMWSGDQSGVITVWRLKDGEALLVCRQLQGRVTSLRKVGSRVYAGGVEGRICVFNAGDCTVVNRLDDHMGSNISAVACAVEVNRYFVWSGSADNTIRCWHHDEHQPMTAEREEALDMRWFFTTQMPYLQANEELLETQRELTELLVLTSGADDSTRCLLDNLAGHETTAARCWLLGDKVKRAQKRCEAAEEEARVIDAALEKKKRTLAVLHQHLARVTEALSNARRQPLQSAPGASSTLPLPGVAPVPLPPPLTAVLSTSPSGTLVPLEPTVSAPPSRAPPGPTSIPAAPPPPPAVTVPAPIPAAVPPPPVVTVCEHTSSQPRVVNETQVTFSRSYEPVLSPLPPPPVATVPPPPPASGARTIQSLPVKTTTPPPTRRMSF